MQVREKNAPTQTTPAQGSTDPIADALIPLKNWPALVAYYCGVFSIIPLLGLLFGPVALGMGTWGLVRRRNNPAVRGTLHALVGVGVGGLSTAAHVLLVAAPFLLR